MHKSVHISQQLHFYIIQVTYQVHNFDEGSAYLFGLKVAALPIISCYKKKDDLSLLIKMFRQKYRCIFAFGELFNKVLFVCQGYRFLKPF